MRRRLVARLDNVGDVVLAGPAVRAVAAHGAPVTFLAGPAGAPAAELLPGVDEVLVYDAAWVPFDARPLDREAFALLIARLSARRIDSAVVLTSFHQSPLPLAMILRLAGVHHIAATCVDYPGSLLDVRVPYVESLHEVEQGLAVCAAAGYHLPPGDRGELRLRPDAVAEFRGPPSQGALTAPYVVVHPGASVPARQLPVVPTGEIVRRLTERGWHVVLTGTPNEARLVLQVARPGERVHVLTGRTPLPALAGLLAGAAVVVCGNTGTAHLAAAVGTPVVEAFAPVVAPHRWRPWGVPHELFGSADIACAGCRSRICPVPGQPCLDEFEPATVVAAIERLAGGRLAGERVAGPFPGASTAPGASPAVVA